MAFRGRPKAKCIQIRRCKDVKFIYRENYDPGVTTAEQRRCLRLVFRTFFLRMWGLGRGCFTTFVPEVRYL